MNVKALLNKRVLLKINGKGWSQNHVVEEFKVLELSPSGNWVKLQNLNGNKFWKPIQEVAFVEELQELNHG